MNSSGTVDVAALVKAGLLNLDLVFDKADWQAEDDIIYYIAYRFGDNNERGEVSIVLQSAVKYGIKAYRWQERNPNGSTGKYGSVMLDSEKVEDEGEEYANKHDEDPDGE